MDTNALYFLGAVIAVMVIALWLVLRPGRRKRRASKQPTLSNPRLYPSDSAIHTMKNTRIARRAASPKQEPWRARRQHATDKPASSRMTGSYRATSARLDDDPNTAENTPPDSLKMPAVFFTPDDEDIPTSGRKR